MLASPDHPVSGYQTVPVSGLRGGVKFSGHDKVIEEVPVALEYNGISHAVMMTTPSDLEDFALGFSYSEGVIDDISQIQDIEQSVCETGITLSIQLASPCFMRLKEHRRSLNGRTGCGVCGIESLKNFPRRPQLTAKTSFEASAISQALSNIRDRQLLLEKTGASHAAAWCTSSGVIVLLREDVGRHNALDKLIGSLLRSKITTSEGFIAVTSRASYEMVQKTASIHVSALAAVSGVTSLAIEVAESSGLSLLGFARGKNMSIYSHPENIQTLQNNES